MRLLVLDFETTSADSKTCFPIEFAARVYDPGKDWMTTDSLNCLIWEPGYPKLTPQIEELTGITDGMLRKCGTTPDDFYRLYQSLPSVDYLCAYNAQFDREVLHRLLEPRDLARRVNPNIMPWFCLMSDFPWPDKLMRCKQLGHRALDLGIPMDSRPRHRAMSDVELCMEILDTYDLNEVMEYHRIPWAYVRAKVPPPWTDGGKGRDMAKAAGFGWEKAPGDDRVFPKEWVSRIKVGEEPPSFPFPVIYE